MELQTGYWSKAELEFIKRAFSEDGEKFLMDIRKVLLGFNVEVYIDENVLKIITKLLLPKIDSEVPLIQQRDNYFNLPVIQQMNPAIAILHIEAKDKEIEYLKERIGVLCGEDSSIVLNDLTAKAGSPEERYVNMLAFVNTVGGIDNRLNELKSIANTKELTEAEKKKMEKANSTQ